MIVDGQEISITLYDTPAANALYDMLPLDLNFEDFNGIEKISYFSQELPTEGEPDGCDPDDKMSILVMNGFWMTDHA